MFALMSTHPESSHIARLCNNWYLTTNYRTFLNRNMVLTTATARSFAIEAFFGKIRMSSNFCLLYNMFIASSIESFCQINFKVNFEQISNHHLSAERHVWFKMGTSFTIVTLSLLMPKKLKNNQMSNRENFQSWISTLFF